MSLLCYCPQVNISSSPVDIVAQLLSGMDTETAEYLHVCTTIVASKYLWVIYITTDYDVFSSLVAQSSARFSGHSHNEVPPVVQPESTTPNVDSILKRRVTWAPDVGSTASPPLPPPPPHHHHHSRPHSLPVAVKSPTSSVPQPSPEHVDAKPKKSKGRKVLSQFRKIFRKSTITVDETSSYLTLSPVDDMMMLSTQLNSTRTVIWYQISTFAHDF